MDQKLRNLHRLAALGDERARVRLFLAEGKAGQFDFERLRLAAYLGHGPTREILDELAPVIPSDLQAWAFGLAHWGRAVAVVGALAAVQFLREQGPDVAPGPSGLVGGERVTFEDLLPTVDAWVGCPCGEHVRAVRNRRRHLHRALERARRVLDWDRASRTVGGRSLARAAVHAGEAVYTLTGVVVTRRRLVARELQRTVWSVRNGLIQLGLTARQAETGVRDAVAATVLPLALEGCGGEVT